MEPVLQPTVWIGETVEGMVHLAPGASRSLLGWLLEQSGAELLEDVRVFHVGEKDGGRDFVLYPDGTMRPLSWGRPASMDPAAAIVAAAGASRPDAPPTSNGRVSDLSHQGHGLPEGTSGAPVDGPWRPYKVSDDEYVPHHADRDVFDSIESTPTFEECWPRCWYLNAAAPDGIREGA